MRDHHPGRRVLRFVATSAIVVAPVSFIACGGATNVPEGGNVDHEVDHERTNVAPEEPGTNVDHTAEPHTNVAPEETDEGGDGESAPE